MNIAANFTLSTKIKARARLLADTRLFFALRDVLEVITPTLSRAASSSPLLDSFIVSPIDVDSGSNYYLHTSPEFMMKRLLAEDVGAIYQICQTYRAGEVGQKHNPEFQMLEWYRPGFELEDLMQEVEQFFRFALGDSFVHWQTVTISLETLFTEKTGLNPFNATVVELQKLAQQKLELTAQDVARLALDRDGWLDLLMSAVVEPSLSADALYFVHGFPASQAALARVDPLDSRLAERFEVYAKGMELANGYRELIDADEQLTRFEDDKETRAALGKTVVPIDLRLVEALRKGIPECSGVAVGLDRLLMLKMGTSKIQDVIPLDWERI